MGVIYINDNQGSNRRDHWPLTFMWESVNVFNSCSGYVVETVVNECRQLDMEVTRRWDYLGTAVTSNTRR